MNFLTRAILWVGVLPALPAVAQTMTEAGSVPAVGLIVNYNDYFLSNPGTMATSGTGNTWDLSTATTTGNYNYFIFHAPAASPYAATYPSTTLCAEVQSNGAPTEWRHWHVSSTLAELVGVNSEVFGGGRTLCEFPFDLGDSFTDSYVINGISTTDDIQYVASGEIVAPWGTIPDVLMYAINGGVAYAFYTVDNALEQVGSYVPGFGFQVEEVSVYSGIPERGNSSLDLWPVPANDHLNFTVPFAGRCTIQVLDATGKVELRSSVGGVVAKLDVEMLAPGVHVVQLIGENGMVATGRFVKS